MTPTSWGGVAGRGLRLLGGLAVLASAALPCLRDEAGRPASLLRLLIDQAAVAVLLGALVTFALPYFYGAFLALSAFWPMARTGRARGMWAVAFSVLASLGAGLAGTVLMLSTRGQRLAGLFLLAVAMGGLWLLRLRLRDDSGDIAGMARGALRIGAVVVAVWFIVLYVDDHLAGPLLGLGGALAALAGLTLDEVDGPGGSVESSLPGAPR